MKRWKRSWTLLCVLLSLTLQHAWAQVATTAVQDTVYRADGSPAAGSVLVSWNAFTTALGNSVPAGTLAITLGAGGSLSAQLAPNAGATPMGSYYTATYHLSDGSNTREYWVVPVQPAGGAAVTLSAIRNAVLPLSVAMQTVSKGYVDTAIARALAGVSPADSSPYVEKAGDTMTGPLILSGDPVSAEQAANKNYVDTNVTALGGGLGRKVDTLPTATQVVQQPVGTQLQVNDLNGELYATPYISSTAPDGIATALTSGNCGAAGCVVKVEPNYTGENLSGLALTSKQRVEDQRGGSVAITAVDPLNPQANGAQVADDITVVRQRSAADVKAENPGVNEVDTIGLRIVNRGVAGGSNQFPGDIEGVPYFKSSFTAASLQGIYNTQGQHALLSMATHCYGVGDCTIGGQYLYASGGTRDVADEGAHPFDLQIVEDPQVYEGVCATGCTSGATTLTITATSADGSQGDGRFLLNKNPAKDITTGLLTGGANVTVFPTAEFSGTSFPVSVFLLTATAATSQPTNLAPGTVTLAIQTTAVPAQFATNTAALPAASGVACLADSSDAIANFETVAYTVVDGTHVRVTANKVHNVNSTFAVGGLCGYGLEETVDTFDNIRQVFPVIGSTSATELYYIGGRTPIVGVPSTSGGTGGYQNISRTVAAISRSGGVVSVTLTQGLPADFSGTSFTVNGVADATYNGTFAINQTGNNTLTYASAGPDSTSSGGTLAFLTGGYVLYPMAEALSVMDPANKSVDGVMQLAANTVAWAAGDAVEMPHYYQEDISPDTEFVTQITPHPEGSNSGGIKYQGIVGPTIEGWRIENGADASIYLGHGGTHVPPPATFVSEGVWSNILAGQAGEGSLFSFTCNSHGCGRYDSAYNLFELESASGVNTLNYQPQNDTVSWTLGGVAYTFAPGGFTAGTINVGTLNATTIAGGVSGGAINSGTISVARLPVFGPSGTTHSAGIVPDPGPIAGATRFLREDGVFAVPATGSGGTTGGGAGGDLSGTFPNPTVSAVHAIAGTLDGVTIGASAASSAVFAASGASPALLVNSNDTANCNPASSFSNQYSVVGSATSGIFFAYNQAANTACIGALTPGVAWRNLVMQPQAGSVGVQTYTNALYANFTVGAQSTNTNNFALTETGTAGQRGFVFALPAGGGLELRRLNSGAVSAAIASFDGSGNATGRTFASTVTTSAGFQEVLFTPASSTAACTAGQFADDANFHYVCVAANTWKRVALASF